VLSVVRLWRMVDFVYYSGHVLQLITVRWDGSELNHSRFPI